MEMLSRFFAPPGASFFLFGPRGTGKTTLVKAAFPKALFVDLLHPETFRAYSARPERLRERLLAEPEVETVVIDEIHTPDSSRYWQAATYEERFAAGRDPEGLDKEYVRTWLKNERGFTGSGDIPPIPDEIRVEASSRYIRACEQVTGRAFVPDEEDPIARIARNLGISP